jgi:hypothetical protein
MLVQGLGLLESWLFLVGLVERTELLEQEPQPQLVREQPTEALVLLENLLCALLVSLEGLELLEPLGQTAKLARPLLRQLLVSQV